jgi:hypothetical protein
MNMTNDQIAVNLNTRKLTNEISPIKFIDLEKVRKISDISANQTTTVSSSLLITYNMCCRMSQTAIQGNHS